MNTLVCVAFVVVMATASVSGFTYEEENIAKYAVGTLGRQYQLVQILEIQKQVVAGTMYHITADVRETLMGGVSGGVVETCTIKVWKKLDGSILVTDSECH